MRTASFRRKTLLLLLVAVLATPWPLAADPPQASSRPAKTAAPAPFELLRRAWSFLQSAWSKEGCRIDPSGLCLSAPAQQPTLQTDTGCAIDPGGLCHS